MADQFPPPTPQAAPPAEGKKAWYRRTWVIATAVFLVGIGLGAASAGTTDPKTTPEYKRQAEKLQDMNAELNRAETDLAEAQTEISTKLGDIPAREDALETGEADLKTLTAALAAKEKDVNKREKAVGIVETEIAKNTIDGEGIYEVGTDIKAGKYKTDGGADCYYAVLDSTDTSDIADNGNVSGPAFVTVRPGQYLQLSGCSEWHLQR